MITSSSLEPILLTKTVDMMSCWIGGGETQCFLHGSWVLPPPSPVHVCTVCKAPREISSSAFGFENSHLLLGIARMLGRGNAYCMSLQQKIQTMTICDSRILAPERRHYWQWQATKSSFTRVSLKTRQVILDFGAILLPYLGWNGRNGRCWQGKL